MRSPLFKGTPDTGSIPRCEKCNSVSYIRYQREVDDKKIVLCPLCSSEIPLPPIKHRPGIPSRRIEMEVKPK